MASQEDYFQMLGKKALSEPDNEVSRASLLLKQLESENPGPEQYRMAQLLEDTLMEDASSMGKIDELRRLGSLGFVQKYGLGPKAKQYVGLRNDELEQMSGADVTERFDNELLQAARARGAK